MSVIYNINRRKNTNDNSIQIASNLTEKTYVDSTAEPNSYYLYSIEAEKDGGTKSISSEVEVFTFNEYADSFFRMRRDISDTGNNPKTFTNNGVVINDDGGVFNGGQYITTEKSTDFQFGTYDFTIEFCIIPQTLNAIIIDMRDLYNVPNHQRNYANCTAISPSGMEWTNGNQWLLFPYSFQLGVRYSCAITRKNGVLMGFVNGVKVGQHNDLTGMYNISALTIGSSFDDVGHREFFNGSITNVRTVKGVAKYTENYEITYQDK